MPKVSKYDAVFDATQRLATCKILLMPCFATTPLIIILQPKIFLRKVLPFMFPFATLITLCHQIKLWSLVNMNDKTPVSIKQQLDEY